VADYGARSSASCAAAKSSSAQPTLLNRVMASRPRALESAGRKLGEFAEHRARIDDAARDRANDFSRFLERAGARVDIQLGARDGLVIGLAHLRE
jgi:tetrahydromethanopterin S-methyltransferase subunit G